MNKKILIVGGSGHGRVAEEILQENGYDVVGFLDDNLPISGKILGGIRDIKNICKSNSIDAIFIAIGDNSTRYNISLQIKLYIDDIDYINVISKYSYISPSVSIGYGNFIGHGCIINTNCSLGNFCILNTSCSLDHDSILDDYSSLAPKVVTGGNFSLGKFSAICIGSVIIHNISIGSSCVVGASSLVLSNISDNQLVYGSPSKFIKNRYFNDRYL